jgi:7-cyano-7-deazaguanine reductase
LAKRTRKIKDPKKDNPAGNLKALGRKVTGYPRHYAPEVLEVFGNEFPKHDYVVELDCPEFTSLCPITGQPDFGKIRIRYSPDKWLVESKSLKIYFFSFRNHGAFHEDCTLEIAGRLVDFLRPRWLRIGGYWYPRGGMPIDVFWQTGRPPAGLWIPEQGVPAYRGRG